MTKKLQIRLIMALLVAGASFGSVTLAGAMGPQTQAPDIAGKWHFVFDTGDGTREFDATLQSDGDKVTGKWMDQDDVKGTYADGKLSLEFAVSQSEVGPGTLKIVGEASGDSLTGTWAFQTYDGTFKATRTKSPTT